MSYDAIKLAVQQHHDRGTDAGVVRRAMVEWAPYAEEQIVRAVTEVYGPTS